MELLKPLKDEHLPEISAMVNTIAFYAKQKYELEQDLQRTLFVWTTLHDAWDYCIEHSISKDNPGELARYAVLTEQHRKDYTALTEEHSKLFQTIEALHEALTFWLAARYDFDPMRDRYELDLENNVLRKQVATVVQEQEKEEVAVEQ